MRRLAASLVFLISGLGIFAYGVGVGKYNWFPHDLVKQAKYLTTGVEFDEFGRLVSDTSKLEVDCPQQTENVGVLFAFGQSNSANHAEYKYQSDKLGEVYNYFDGKCYAASSPLLGTTGADGEWISKVASNLISLGTYEKVVVVSTGIGGTPVVRWAQGNDLNEMLVLVLAKVALNYRVTDVVWHQGESDRHSTFTQTYEEMFNSVLNTLRQGDVKAPVFMSIASICGDDWVYPNRVTQAQNNLTQLSGVEMGVNTDELVKIDMRYDKCHFSKEGQELAANELARLIASYHK